MMDLDFLFLFFFIDFMFLFLLDVLDCTCFSVRGFACLCESSFASSLISVSFGRVLSVVSVFGAVNPMVV